MSQETDGQSDEGTLDGTTGSGTEGNAGAQTTGNGTDSGQEEVFFDPNQVPEELKPAYKLMQRAFSEKTTSVSKQREKIEAYDRFMQNPVQEIKAMAQQYGLTLSQSQAEQVSQNWEPKSWEEVMTRAKQEASKELLSQIQPIVSEVQQTKKANIERMLDDNCPDWKMYEDDMKKNLEKHPSLVNDPVLLYEVSLPKKVRESRATQKALDKLEGKTKSSQVSSGSNTSKKGESKPGKMSFNESVEFAKARLAERGIHAPR